MQVNDVFYHKNMKSPLKKGVITSIGRKYVYVTWKRDSGGCHIHDYRYKYTKDKFLESFILMSDPVYES